MRNDEIDNIDEDEQVLTPDDGFRLVVRLMRRYIDRMQYREASLRRSIQFPYRYSPVRPTEHTSEY